MDWVYNSCFASLVSGSPIASTENHVELRYLRGAVRQSIDRVWSKRKADTRVLVRAETYRNATPLRSVLNSRMPRTERTFASLT